MRPEHVGKGTGSAGLGPKPPRSFSSSIYAILGSRSDTVFLHPTPGSLSQGSWQTWRLDCWLRGMGNGAWHFFPDSHCLSLVLLPSRSHAPPLPVPRDPAVVRAEALGGDTPKGFPPTTLRLPCQAPA